MTLHPDELRLARAYNCKLEFEQLSSEQLRLIHDFGRNCFRWYRKHPRTHNLINGVLLLFIFVTDGLVLVGLPRLLLNGGSEHSLPWILLASLLAGSLHSWLMYSLILFSLHEGAAHDLIFSGTGSVAKAAQFVARNLCRFAVGEPNQYAECHMAHHAKFGTAHDSEFLNFVIPHRYFLTFLPFAAMVNFSDFLAHRPLTYTRSRVISGVISALYNAVYAYFLYRSFGLAFTLITMLVFLPHVGFYVDRLRQFTEHNLMPLESHNGARSFGVGFWGLVVGGGPWGQPCHLAHHLVPSVPWYQQVRLHFFIRRLLTKRQREQFLIRPFVGFPLLLWRVIRETTEFASGGGATKAGVEGFGDFA